MEIKKKYFLIQYNSEKYWVEVNDDNCAERQIVLDEKEGYHISCVEDCLMEGVFFEQEVEGEVTCLEKDEFEEVWQSLIKKYDESWKRVKGKYRVGDSVQGVCCYFYPQGPVIKGEGFMAIYRGDEGFLINQEVEGIIRGYDDTNMWLVLSDV